MCRCEKKNFNSLTREKKLIHAFDFNQIKEFPGHLATFLSY